MASSQAPGAMSGEEDEAGSQALIDEILDLYRFHWVPEYRLKFKKELAGYTLGLAVSKPHEASTRLRVTLKPDQVDQGWGPGRFVQKILVMPQQRFTAMYSRKLALGFLRFQFVAGYFWDTRRPSLDYRLTTKWNDGLTFKRKEYIQPTTNLLVRTCWSLDLQLPQAEGHLGGGPGSTQIPVEVEYGSVDFSVTQMDFICDFDGFKNRNKVDSPKSLFAAAQPLELSATAAAAAASGCTGCSCGCCGGARSGRSGNLCGRGCGGGSGTLSQSPLLHVQMPSSWPWPWQHTQRGEGSRAG
ncbi:hypothetical protein Vretimale_4175 [Volvox reticuliferus]|uniref:DUF7781 domain-containing protein n=1 Tax=Volvox reticuliferus TaxID=1737510 RepID=A0A8J4DAH8_9CHLO|nr:hypothetical protein Vretifemale_2826 [Volvox reticuliferus]GIL98951.1 hypothetical protein Vretimale_4175 [Volvox reticuliferus]